MFLAFYRRILERRYSWNQRVVRSCRWRSQDTVKTHRSQLNGCKLLLQQKYWRIVLCSNVLHWKWTYKTGRARAKVVRSTGLICYPDSRTGIHSCSCHTCWCNQSAVHSQQTGIHPRPAHTADLSMFKRLLYDIVRYANKKSKFVGKESQTNPCVRLR